MEILYILLLNNKLFPTLQKHFFDKLGGYNFQRNSFHIPSQNFLVKNMSCQNIMRTYICSYLIFLLHKELHLCRLYIGITQVENSALELKKEFEQNKI